MQAIYITRKQYDAMVCINPDFMRVDWPKSEKKWCISGIHVKVKSANEYIAIMAVIEAATF